MPRFLLVTKEYSEAPTSGGMQRTLAIADTLSRYGNVVVVSPEGTVRRERGQVIYVSDMPEDERAFAKLVMDYRSISGARAGGTKLLQGLARAVKQRYDLAVIDHTCLVGLHDIVARHADHVVVSMHNIESMLMLDRASAAPLSLAKAAMYLDGGMLSHLEQVVGKAGYTTIVTTGTDQQTLGLDHTIVARNGVFPDRIQIPDALPKASLLFAGALDWEPNIRGLIWFVRSYWGLLRTAAPDVTLTIAGRRPDPRLRDLTEFPGVEVHADPADMMPLFHNHAIGIVPLLTGGGSRLKILEYLAAGMDVVSTQTGAEGFESIPRSYIDVVPNAYFGEAVLERLQDPRDNRVDASNWIRVHYTWDRTMKAFADYIQTTVGAA